MGRKARAGTANAYAKRMEMSRQRVSQLKQTGKLVLKEGEIDAEASAKRHDDRLAAQQTSPSRQIKDHYDAKMAKLAYERAIGQVVDRKLVEQDAFRVGRVIRDALMGLPDRLSGTLASESSQQKIHALLMKEFRQVLEHLTVEAVEAAE